MGLQKNPGDAAAVAARAAAAAYYAEMEALLAGRECLAGPCSYADIAFFMAQLFGARMGAGMGSAVPSLLQWRDRMIARPAVRRVVDPMVAYLASTGRAVPDFLKRW